MRPNIGVADQFIRMSIGLILAAMGALVATKISVLPGLLMLFAGAFSACEATVRWCIIYQLLGKNTCRVPER